MDPTKTWAHNIVTSTNCGANSTCGAGTLTLSFKHPVRNPRLNISGLGAQTGDYDNHTSLRLKSVEGTATLEPARPGATLRVVGQTIQPIDGARARASCANAVGTRGGCGTVPVTGTVKSLTFDMLFTNNQAAGSNPDRWLIAPSVEDDCSNAPDSYGSASHVVGDLTLGPDVTEDMKNTSLTAACRRADDENDLAPDLTGLAVDMTERQYSTTVPVNSPSAASYAAAWIDFNGNGTFDEGERATAAVAAGATEATFTWAVPDDIKAGQTWSRFRLGYTQGQTESATGMADSGEVEDWQLTIDSPPALRLEKSVTPETVAKAGDEVTYSFKVTNTGNVAVSDVKIDETAFSGTGTKPEVICPAGSVEPGGSVTCTAKYKVTQADVDAGKVDNTATATATPPPGRRTPVSNESSAKVTAAPAPKLELEKSASKNDDLRVGEEITYSFKATNTGNVTLTDVKVNEGAFSGSGKMSAITCPDEAKSLAPGASVTCTATYVVTQADVDAGKITNTATSSGTPPGGGDPVTSDPDTVIVPGNQTPALELVKSADKDKLVVGETVTYSFKATNAGNVTLTDVKIDEGAFSGSGKMSAITCPDAAKSLAPGASVTCTATYKVTQADVDAGKVDNTATATGTPPGGGDPVTSDPSRVTVPADRKPALTLVKSADKGKVVVGETVTYSFKATNTGNVT
ncbi:GEVED domain-containing protein, partial [Streptomyces sp. NPDC050504]|uniref:DUF7507 domain-containing protein n=1 Tax=Streptomyces sp. NPDC050504 TaxID=3365618 RepID=UPI00379E2D5B